MCVSPKNILFIKKCIYTWFQPTHQLVGVMIVMIVTHFIYSHLLCTRYICSKFSSDVMTVLSKSDGLQTPRVSMSWKMWLVFCLSLRVSLSRLYGCSICGELVYAIMLLESMRLREALSAGDKFSLCRRAGSAWHHTAQPSATSLLSSCTQPRIYVDNITPCGHLLQSQQLHAPLVWGSPSNS